MSASHFGTTYWLDDYFGSYFQPESGGGSIIGALSGTFAGTSSFSGALEQPADEYDGHGARYWRTVRKNRAYRQRLKDLYEEVRNSDLPEQIEAKVEAIVAPLAPGLGHLPPPNAIDWEAITAEKAKLLRQALVAAAEAIEQEDEESILLLLAA